MILTYYRQPLVSYAHAEDSDPFNSFRDHRRTRRHYAICSAHQSGAAARQQLSSCGTAAGSHLPHCHQRVEEASFNCARPPMGHRRRRISERCWMSARACKCGGKLAPGRVRCKRCHAKYMRKWRRDHPDDQTGLRVAARAFARKRKARGTLVNRPCAVCGDPSAEMHHPDYERPLDVTWLCKRHHADWHKFWRKLVLEQFEQWVAGKHRAMSQGESSRVQDQGVTSTH
jgi:hypothetical protein